MQRVLRIAVAVAPLFGNALVTREVATTAKPAAAATNKTVASNTPSADKASTGQYSVSNAKAVKFVQGPVAKPAAKPAKAAAKPAEATATQAVVSRKPSEGMATTGQYSVTSAKAVKLVQGPVVVPVKGDAQTAKPAVKPLAVTTNNTAVSKKPSEGMATTGQYSVSNGGVVKFVQVGETAEDDGAVHEQDVRLVKGDAALAGLAADASMDDAEEGEDSEEGEGDEEGEELEEGDSDEEGEESEDEEGDETEEGHDEEGDDEEGDDAEETDAEE